jgi:hypothetical protein
VNREKALLSHLLTNAPPVGHRGQREPVRRDKGFAERASLADRLDEDW